MRAALVKNGRVENVIMVDPEVPFAIPDHETVTLADDQFCEPGSTYDGKVFARVAEPEATKEKGPLRALLEALSSPKDADEQAAAEELKVRLASAEAMTAEKETDVNATR